jgi:hypothetical protein
VLAVLALAAGLASAQIGTFTGSAGSAGALSCTANGAAIPQLRVEGFTELLGDILISCTGGSPAAQGSVIPTTNITVTITNGGNITSRLFSSSSGLSEAALLIDEPGSGLPTGVVGYGPLAPQKLCTVSSGCTAVVGSNNGYEVALDGTSGALAGSAAANIYQGYLNTVGTNTVTFYGVPVLPPVTTGVSRYFRITNIRYPVTTIGNQTQIIATLSTNPSQQLPLVQSGFPVGVVISPGLTTKIGGALGPFPQCTSQKSTLSTTLSFTEGFATAFKTRVVPLTNTTYAAEATNSGTPGQNIPGGTYGQFAANSESGFIIPGDTNGGSGTQYTAGLADFGTRLKAVFTNIPAGITLYVSAVNVNPGNTGFPSLAAAGTQTLTLSEALLVSTGTGEATADTVPFAPIGITSTTLGAAGEPIVALAASTATATLGQATAIWEVTNSQPSAVETFSFNVYVAYAAAPGSGITTTNPYGLPQINGILGAALNNVSLSFAPEPSQGAFSASAGPVAGTNIIPRFTVANPSNGLFANITLCQTTLLYPFVTNSPVGSTGGFDTGIAVANTSMDPFGTKFSAGVVSTSGTFPISNTTSALPQTGSCTLYPYGATISSTGATSAGPTIKQGCDFISNAVPGTNCFPVVTPGSVQAVNASNIFPGFQGYVIAVCNFQYAHGYAAVTDLGLRNLFSSYLALDLSPNPFNCTLNGTAIACGSATTNRGVGIEGLLH